jgi:hypothetical protein
MVGVLQFAVTKEETRNIHGEIELLRMNCRLVSLRYPVLSKVL